MQYITPKGYQVLADEYKQLKFVERPQVVAEVSAAAALGDRSENAEYIFGKRRLRQIDSRLRFLDTKFADMQTIDPSKPRGNKIFFGATVTVIDDETDEELVYQIVGPMDNLDRQHVSYESPIGKALMGRSLDDEVRVVVPKGIRTLIITKIEYI